MVIEGEALKTFVPFDRYSSFSKPVGVTKNIIKFPYVKFGLDVTSIDFEKQAKIHLLKAMQSEMFKEEIAHIKNPSKNSLPGLHEDWDLFLNTSGLLRS